MKSYQQETVNKHGETVISDIFRYIEGEPKQYRYNSQTGQFNIDGDTPVLDKSGKPIKEFTFQPFVFRIFEDGLFNRNREPWAELFFIDALNCVSSIMFNGTTLTELRGVMKKLIYEGNEPLNLCDVVLTIRPEKLTSKNDPTKSWFIGRFQLPACRPRKCAATCGVRGRLPHLPARYAETHGELLQLFGDVRFTLNRRSTGYVARWRTSPGRS